MKRAGGHQIFGAIGRQQLSVSKSRISGISSRRFWQIAAVTVAGTIGLTAQAEAAVFWSDDDGGYSRPVQMPPQRMQRIRRRASKQIETPVKEAAKPQGPLIIAISISHQNLKVYDANGFFAETPISTGMAGHSTPMGAFSVIQKQKLHHSNIYSGAPMPFMQRITWSGIAMHAGVLPGYPASHGCIRMPMAFAVKMYGWTKMGARVVVTPDEMTPTSFSHPLLITQKIVPQPVAANTPKPDMMAKSNKSAAADATKTETSVATLDLRSSVSGISGNSGEPRQTATRLSEQTHTADAGMTVTMSDATPAVDQAAGNASTEPKSESEPVGAKSSETPPSDDKSIEPKSADSAAADAAKVSPSVSAPDAAKASETSDKKVTSKPDENTADTTTADVKKDQARPSDGDKVIPVKPVLAIAKGTGPISAFVSRKDSKLYVRQNFAPLFQVPVTIVPSDRPLGTHIFTAEADKNDANILHWSVVTLPSRHVERRDDDERVSRRRKIAGAVEIAKPVPQPDSPTEALDRLNIPSDAMARINDALSTGGSIIVSDQGIAAGETGEGTDFIVSLR